MRRRRCPVCRQASVSFVGFRFPPEVILLAVRWYLRYGLSYRDLEELLAERGIDVDHVTLYRWVQRFTPLVIDVLVSSRRDTRAAKRFFTTTIGAHGEPEVVTTDRSPALARAIVEVVPDVAHGTTQYANNRVEAKHARLTARLRPMRGLKQDRTATVVIRGHAFIQNLRRGHYELGVHAQPKVIVAVAFDELLRAV